MFGTHVICRAAAIGIGAALSLGAFGSSADAGSPHFHCTGKAPEYDPADLNYMRSSVSAASRLALAIRWREYLATCHPAKAHPHHYAG